MGDVVDDAALAMADPANDATARRRLTKYNPLRLSKPEKEKWGGSGLGLLKETPNDPVLRRTH